MMKQVLIQQLKNAVIDSPHVEVFYTEITTSTNDWAWEYFAEQSASFSTPTLFIASEQKKGEVHKAVYGILPMVLGCT
ncbi:MAG: hypothetical protein NTW61_06025 [Candidatus Melainabacteria bacterium]|nr:hypothetical protein [Candidatus Melainabacteria bacterium]